MQFWNAEIVAVRLLLVGAAGDRNCDVWDSRLAKQIGNRPANARSIEENSGAGKARIAEQRNDLLALHRIRRPERQALERADVQLIFRLLRHDLGDARRAEPRS